MTQIIYSKIYFLKTFFGWWSRLLYSYQRMLRRTLHRSVIKGNNYQFPFVYGFLIISLAGCSVGKKYQQPELELPKQFGTVSFADTSSIAEIEWKQFF